tara:strand:+ start:589 stop:1134 length:546 start_codon:yes stop_codon:yes gene_type:complete
LIIGCGSASDESKLVGNWTFNTEKTKIAVDQMEPPEFIELENWEMGKQFLVSGMKGYFINFNEDKTFTEFSALGPEATGKWQLEKTELIRDYEMNEFVKRAIEMNVKALEMENPEDYEDTAAYEDAIKDTKQSIKNLKASLHNISGCEFLNDNLIKIIISPPAGPTLQKMEIPLLLDRVLD